MERKMIFEEDESMAGGKIVLLILLVAVAGLFYTETLKIDRVSVVEEVYSPCE